VRAWFAVSAAVLAIAALPGTLEAQGGRDLGSPAPPGSRVTPADEARLEGVEAPPPSAPVEPPPTAPPTAYEGVEVPPPPGTGIRYPGAEGSREMQTDSGVRIASGTATRLRALDSAFQVLAARGGGGSWVGGIVSILGGALSLTLGVVYDLQAGHFGATISPYLYIYGGAGAVRGILELALMSNPSVPAITFAQMPMRSMDEVEERLEYGESQLEALAERSLVQRVLDGSISIATGLAFVPFFVSIATAPGFDAENILLWVGVAGAAVSAISGVITLISTSEAERRWSAYVELRDRLAARGEPVEEPAAAADEAAVEDEELSSSGLELSPLLSGGPQGGAVGVHGRF
jgi:hypothetical protein